MSYEKIIKKSIFSFVLLFAICGCDKIPFLSQFFPSSKKVEPQPAPAPVVPVQEELPADVLARVGKWTLTPDAFKEKLNSLKEAIPDFNTNSLDSKKLVLEELIRQQLLVQDAEANGLAQKKDILDAVDEFRRTLLVREMATKITEGMDTTDQEAQDYYNQNKGSFMSPAEWHLREIVVPTQDEAKEILIELLKGTDFATMAQTRSKSKSAAKGGDLGPLKELPFPQMETAVSALDVGSVSSVFKGPEGYYIVKLEEKKGGVPFKFEEIKGEIKTGLTLQKQQQKILSYIDELKGKTKVETREELLK